MKMKNILLLVFVLVSYVEFSFCEDIKMRTQEFPKEEMQKQKSEVAKLMAKGLSKTLPQKVDSYTTLTKVTNEGSTLIYTFEIDIGVKKDETVIKEDHSRMRDAVLTGVCQSSSKLLEASINTTYRYISTRSKKMLFKFEITQSKCLGLK